MTGTCILDLHSSGGYKASCSQDEVPGGQRGVVMSQPSEEIPEDPLLAETHYSQYEDFESSDVSAVSVYVYRWCTIDALG